MMQQSDCTVDAVSVDDNVYSDIQQNFLFTWMVSVLCSIAASLRCTFDQHFELQK